MKLPELVDKIDRTFNLSEIRGLCFQLSIDYENLSGENKKDKIISLVNYCKNRRKLEELVNQCKILRPKEFWHFNESWYLVESISLRQSTYRLWIAGTIVFVLLIAGLVNYLPSYLTPVNATSTEHVQATVISTLSRTEAPTETAPMITPSAPSVTPTPIPMDSVDGETAKPVRNNTPVSVSSEDPLPINNVILEDNFDNLDEKPFGME